MSFASTYYPGTPVATQAAPDHACRGEERTGIDFALQLVPTARVEGSVTLPDGSPAPAGTQVNLLAGPLDRRRAPSARFGSTRAGRDGAFSSTDVSPGTYTVLARATVPGSQPTRSTVAWSGPRARSRWTANPCRA